MPAPTVSLVTFATFDGLDYFTRNAALTISALEAGGTRSIVVARNGVAGTPTATYTPPNVDGTYLVTVTDTVGGLSTSSIISFVLDTVGGSAPRASLKTNSGLTTDQITNTADILVTGTEANAKVEYAVRASGGTGTLEWSMTAPSFTSDGLYRVYVRQTDLAGNLSAVGELNFTLDTVAPSPPTVTVNLTTDDPEDLTVTSEPAATIEYRFKTGTGAFSAWSATAPDNLVNGTYTVEVRATDVAGNISTSTSVELLVDRDGPATPTVALETDSGRSNIDNVTNDFDLTVAPAPTGQTRQFKIDSGAWVAAMPTTLADGQHTVEVRYLDSLGNASDPVGSITFTLDRTAPAALQLALSSIVAGATAGNSKVVLSTAGAEAFALVEFSIDSGRTWSATAIDDLAAGQYTIQARQIDFAGNVSLVDDIAVTVPTAPVTPPTEPPTPPIQITFEVTGGGGVDSGGYGGMATF